MKNLRSKTANILLSIAVCCLLACSSESGLKPFRSDGCSLFPDAALISGDDWCDCCFDHDVQYWRGGTRAERDAADRQLQRCVEERTGNAALASAMYEGVRLGGSPYFYNWYRWGYGWEFERKYQALSEMEVSAADKLLDEYFATVTAPACAD